MHSFSTKVKVIGSLNMQNSFRCDHSTAIIFIPVEDEKPVFPWLWEIEQARRRHSFKSSWCLLHSSYVKVVILDLIKKALCMLSYLKIQLWTLRNKYIPWLQLSFLSMMYILISFLFKISFTRESMYMCLHTRGYHRVLRSSASVESTLVKKLSQWPSTSFLKGILTFVLYFWPCWNLVVLWNACF